MKYLNCRTLGMTAASSSHWRMWDRRWKGKWGPDQEGILSRTKKFLFCRPWGAMNIKHHDNYSTKKEVSEMLVHRTKENLLPAGVSENFGEKVILVLDTEFLVGSGLSEGKRKFIS